MKDALLDFDTPLAPSPRFDGSDYSPEFDQVRLTKQQQRIWAVIQDGHWRTLREISELAHAPEASVSAQLRHLKKQRFGAHKIGKRSRGDRSRGLFEYRLVKDK